MESVAVSGHQADPGPQRATRLRVQLGTLLPGVPSDDACVERLSEALRRTPGIRRVELLPAEGLAHLEVAFDARQLTEEQVARVARREATRILRQFRHDRLRLGGMDCHECARAVEHVMARLEGVGAVAVDFSTGTMAIEYEPGRVGRRQIFRRVEALGYRVEGRSSALSWLRERRELTQALLAAAAALAGWLSGHLAEGVPSLRLAFFAVAYALAGWPVARELLRTSWRGWLDVDLLMLGAAAGAAAIGEVAEGATLLVLFALAHALEHLAAGRAHAAIQALADMAPRTARRLEGETTREVLVQELRRGDRVLIRPGERVPVDGTVLRGRSPVDQSAVTGENEPVEKGPGSPVYAGSVNGDGVLEVKVTRLSSESTLARMARLVESARTQASPTQRVSERIASVLVPAVLVADLLLATVPPMAGWLSWREAFYRAMALLVAASPCALAIGAPAAGVAGLARAARLGLLVKGSAYLEALGRVRAVAFDKTGTLTVGRPTVRAVHILDEAGRLDEGGLLTLAASAEEASTHPLARAVVEAARARGLSWPAAEELRAFPGQGLEARVEGRRIRVGTLAFARGSSVQVTEPTETASAQGPNGQLVQGQLSARGPSRGEEPSPGETFLFVSVDGRLAGVIRVSDPLRAEAREAIRALRDCGIRHTVILSGDRPSTVRHVASQAGVDEAVASLLPDEKMAAIRALEQRYGPVAMVGDGINDGPALAAASVGIAMGAAGSDVALEAAPAALLGSDLRLIPRAVELGRAVRRVILQNHLIALGVILLLSVATVSGQAGIGPAVAIHEASTVAVAFNGLRLLRWQGRERGTRRGK